MNRKADILIDAIGKVDEKYIERSAPLAGEKRNIMSDGLIMSETGNGLIEITVPKQSPKQIRNHRIRIAAVSGIAAALVITGGVLVWNRLGGLKDPFDSNSVTITSSPDADPVKTYVPDVRDLKWGMTVEEVKAHETETLSSEEKDVLSAQRLQTLLNYDNVRYSDFNTKMILCVDKLSGLNGVNYHVDTEDYPDAFDKLKESLTAEYGKFTDSYGNCEWSMPDKNLTVVLYDWGTDVQVGIFPYIDMSEDSDTTTQNEVTDPSGSDEADDMMINAWTPFENIPEGALPVFPSDLPKTFAEYETVGLPADFDWDEFAKNGYPKVMLAYFPNADAPEGKYDIYLLAASCYADEDDKNIVRGTMFIGIAERGSDKFFALDNVGSDHFAIRMILDTNKIEKYIQIFRVKDENGENRMIIKIAYGENDREYETTFWQVKENYLSSFYNIAGYVGSDPYVGDMEGRNMKLYSELTQEGNEIIDNLNGMAFSFDFEKDEISIRTFVVADDGSSEEETPQPADRDLAVKLKTFDITEHDYCSHEINPGERSLFNPGYLEVAGSTVYVGESGWTDSATILADVKDRLGDDYDSFEAAIKPYCNENGGLDFDKAWALPSPPTGELFRDLYYQTPVQFVYKVIDDKWMICVNENGEDVSVFMKNDKLTSIRRAAEYLWSVFDEYYDMTVTAIYNYETKEGYLLVVSDLCPKINAAMQRDCAADVAKSCRFMTPGDIKPTWLPMTLLKESGGETYLQYIEQLDIYNVALDNGVFSGASWESAAETADRLKQLGQPDAARTFLNEFGKMPETVKDEDELVNALRENVKSFYRVIPYQSIFDPVKLPRYCEAGYTFYYSIGSQVLEVMAEQIDSFVPNYRITYRLLQYSEDLTRVRYNVRNFRDNYTFNDPASGYKGFTIRGIEVISVVEGLETKWQVRLIADESMWEEIERAYLSDMHLMPGDVVLASEPTDTSKLATSIM